jgi:cytochrome c oxidase assembly factor CtaG
MARISQSSRRVGTHLGVYMKKLAIAFAAAAALTVAAAPLTDALAANKKLWEGWVEEMKKAAEGMKKK